MFWAPAPNPPNTKTSSVVGITTRPSKIRQMLIGLLSVVLNQLGSAIASWMVMVG